MMFVGNKETYFECQKSCIMSDIQDGFFCKNNVLKVLIKPLHWPFINCFRSLHLRCFTEQFLLLCLTANTFEVMSFNEKDQDLHYPYQSKILCPGSKSKTKSRQVPSPREVFYCSQVCISYMPSCSLSFIVVQ